MPKIQILPERVIQQIAAGEVVQRPSSVVKELIENSLDAGAQRIEIEINKAGLDLISVRDDGAGMTPEDAMLALTRHATSKLSTSADLNHILSYGFRGEALPSIAAVSSLEMITSVKDALMGTRIISDGASKPVSFLSEAIAGTWITIRNLFFNTPARLKFLKSERTELKHITETITRLAMVRPDVSFRAVSQGRELLTTSGSGNHKEIVELILGKNSIIPWMEINVDDQLGTLRGFIAPPEFARGSRNFQTIVINERWVKSPLIVSAVETAFRPHLIRNQFPSFFLELAVSPSSVDINIHPAKLEVKLSNDKEIWQFIFQSIKSRLRTQAYPHKSSLAQEMAPSKTDIVQNSITSFAVNEHAAFYDKTPTFMGPVKTSPKEIVSNSKDGQFPTAPSNHSWPQLRFIGQAARGYLIADDNSDNVYLLDQHAVHERILYERLGYTWKTDNIPQQHLVVPQTFTVSAEELQFWENKKDTWRKVGLDLEQFGANTIVLRSIPQIMTLKTATMLVNELLSEEQDDQITWEQERLHLQATIACHASLKLGQLLTAQEGLNLLTELAKCKHPFNCPHGRPTLICIGRRELDRRFMRRPS